MFDAEVNVLQMLSPNMHQNEGKIRMQWKGKKKTQICKHRIGCLSFRKNETNLDRISQFGTRAPSKSSEWKTHTQVTNLGKKHNDQKNWVI